MNEQENTATTTAQTTTDNPPATGDNPAPPANDGAPAQGDAQEPHAADNPADGEGDADKPLVGQAPKTSDKPDGDQANQDGNPKPPDEKAYLDAIKKDENVVGKNDALQFDERLVKSVIPVCQKYGISTEAAKDLANAFAKAQIDGAREAYRQRAEYFTKMNNEARARYSDADFAQINRGIDKHFKPGGIMNNVIRNSELGADPEFLALMHTLGQAEKEDTGKGAAQAGGGSSGDPDGIGGMSKLW